MRPYEELSQQAKQEARTYEQDAKWAELLRQLNWEIPDEGKQKHQEALSRAQAMKGRARHTNCLAWQNLIRGTDKANAFSKLSRYETAIERSLYKALHELQRLQAARIAGGSVPPPAAIDANVSGDSRKDL